MTPTQVFSYQFWEIFKNTSFTEHLRCLLLSILKPLDSQTQWCRWISELVTIYFILTFLALAGIFVSIFGEHKLYFHISTAIWLRKYNVFVCHVTTQLKYHVTFWVGPPHPEPAPYQVLGATGLVNKVIQYFWNFHATTSSMCHVTLLVRSPHSKSPPC